ncbi:MAG: cadherin repeat domain-containing protein, partial [Desulfobacterales bacterium]
MADGSLLDYETNTQHDVIVHITDSTSRSYQEYITIQVIDVQEAPVITSNGGGDSAALDVVENTTSVTTVTATDSDGDTPTFSFTGGADQALFEIDTNTGVLTFKTAPDFENPSDTNLDGIYEIHVRADDGNGRTDTQEISVTVYNTSEPTALLIGTEKQGPFQKFGDPNLQFEPTGNTTGTLSNTFDLANFGSDAKLAAIHYVSRDIT